MDSDGDYLTPVYGANSYTEGRPAANIFWETAEKRNYGVELGLFQNLITFTFDYFKEHREDMLIPSADLVNYIITGQDPVIANLGETEMNGYELELGFSKALTNDLRLYGRITHTHSEDKVIFQDDAPLLPDYRKKEGYQIQQTRSIQSTYVI